MRALFTTAIAAALLASAPATAQEAQFEPTGEVRFLGWGSIGTGAAFDGDRIVGPSVNLTRRDDGSWGGDLNGQPLDLEVSPKKATAPNVNVGYEFKDGRTNIEGLFFGQRIRIEIDKKRLHGKIGACSLDLSRKNPQYFQGEMGCTPSGRNAVPQTARATLQLIGDAGNDPPPLPQLVFALIAILPG